MRIYKNKDITTNIDTEKTSINNPDTYFYTEDKGSTALRIFINHHKTSFNLDNTNLTPVLDLFHADGSIWLDEPLEVIMADKGLLQYNIPNNVIAHAGQIKAKLFLKNTEQSVHVANFTFDIKDSGIEDAIEKEISVNLVEDTVKKIMNESPELFKGEKFRFEDFTPEQLEEIKGEKGEGMEKVGMMNVLYNRLYGTLTNYNIPEELNINVPFTVKTAQNGDFDFNYDVGVNKNAVTKRYYVDVNNGSNSNDGTESKPLQSINRALRYADADEIVVQEGSYGWSHGFSGYSQTKPFNLIGKGKVLIGAHRDGVAWNKNSTYSNVYQTNQTNVVEVIDYNSIYDIKFLEKQTSVKGVSDNAGSYYIDSSNNIFVRTHDDRVPDDQILPNMFSDTVKITDNPKVYFENIRFTNSVKLTATKAGNKFYAKNCYFSIGSGGNALSIEGYDYNILQSCVAKYATMDGFNYHAKNGIIPKAIEIDCVGFDNGRNGADQNNGSTIHDGGQIIRIGGEYHNNGGPNVIDVNEGTVSVNIGVHSHSSRATDGTISNTGFKNGNIGKSKMYLVNCIANNSDYSVVTAESQKSVTYIENCLLKEKKGTV